jgi:hypothetical protein
MFTTEQRDRVRDRVLELVRADVRVAAGALTGSAAAGAADRWSDIDLGFGITAGVSLEAILDEWSVLFAREFGVLHHWDLRHGPSIYRVFLLPGGLELDVAVTPQEEFGPRGPNFRTLFGPTRPLEVATQVAAGDLIGLAWHHVLHARAAIERGQPWRAEYWISGIRDQTLALACLRLGESPVYGRGMDRLPSSVSGPLAAALVRSLDEAELRRALAVATASLLGELTAWDAELSAQLRPALQEFGTPHHPDDLP